MAALILQQNLCLVILCFLGILRPVFSISRPSTMVLENNGYKNVVIAIHESVGEDKTLLDKLKEEMTKASKILHTATRQRAYFKEIKIILPSTWSNDASYQVPTSENLAFADVIITDPIRGKRSLPQTRSYDGCGKQGVHVLLTKEFLTVPRSDPYLGNPAKFFIHAFAQFRWGVFQEYAEEGENVFYMSPTSGQPEAIRCTFVIRGLIQKNDAGHTICYSKLLAERQHVVASIDDKTGLYHSDCQWRPYPNHQRTTASIMDHQFIQELITFCGDDKSDYKTFHNFEAPSKHNRLCGHRSTWGVITETDDFKGGNNPTRAMTDDQLKPTFIIMRAPSRKRRSVIPVILVDPAIMKEGYKATSIEKALNHIQHEYSRLGADISVPGEDGNTVPVETPYIETVVSFNETYSSSAEKMFAGYVSDTLQVLKTSDKGGNAHLVIVTNNNLNSIKDVLEEEENASMELTVIIDDTTDLIRNHKDKYKVHATGKSLGHTLLDRLRHVTIIERGKNTLVKQDELKVNGSKPISGHVDTDPYLGGSLSFIFHYENSAPDIDLISPSNVTYGMDGAFCSVDYMAKVVLFHFGSAEEGTWVYTIRQFAKIPQKVNVTVMSVEGNNQQDPLVIRQSVKFTDKINHSLLLHIDVTQGLQPLIGLNVTAKIEKPDGDVTSLQLLDTGAGADIWKNDGIYSRIYITSHMSGPYHVTFLIRGESGKVFRKEEALSTNDENIVKKSVIKHQTMHNIQRQISGGTIYVDPSGNHDPINDAIPPSRITDLEALTYIPYKNSIVLKWTAPGDDHDHGKVAGYELFVGYGITDIRLLLQYISTGIYKGQGHIEQETIPAQTENTEEEIFLWTVKGKSKIYVFAVRALDHYGNKGDVSNIATASANA